MNESRKSSWTQQTDRVALINASFRTQCSTAFIEATLSVCCVKRPLRSDSLVHVVEEVSGLTVNVTGTGIHNCKEQHLGSHLLRVSFDGENMDSIKQRVKGGGERGKKRQSVTHWASSGHLHGSCCKWFFWLIVTWLALVLFACSSVIVCWTIFFHYCAWSFPQWPWDTHFLCLRLKRMFEGFIGLLAGANSNGENSNEHIRKLYKKKQKYKKAMIWCMQHRACCGWHKLWADWTERSESRENHSCKAGASAHISKARKSKWSSSIVEG